MMNNINNNNNWSSEECNSGGGCDSGWTMYLGHDDQDHSYSTRLSQPMNEDDDQSMLSDASSGPPHFHEHDDEDEHDQQHMKKKVMMIRDNYAKIAEKKTKKKVKQGICKLLPFSNIDDTASSTIHNLSQPAAMVSTHNVSNSSSTHLKKKTGFGNPFGFFKSSAGSLDGGECD